MALGGRVPSSKNILSRPPGTIRVRNLPPPSPATIPCLVSRGTSRYVPGVASTSRSEVAAHAKSSDSGRVRGYGQFCPIARTSELLAKRWTLVIVRNLLNGCRTFNEIRQGAPGIPPALLTQRLHLLECHGVLVRTAKASGRGATYDLTEMGQALGPVCDALGQWGARWLEIEPQHLNPAYILWATVKLVDVEALPARTTTPSAASCRARRTTARDGRTGLGRVRRFTATRPGHTLVHADTSLAVEQAARCQPGIMGRPCLPHVVNPLREHSFTEGGRPPVLRPRRRGRCRSPRRPQRHVRRDERWRVRR